MLAGNSGLPAFCRYSLLEKPMTLPVAKRKQKKNPATGLTRRQEKQFKKELTYGVIATASILGVDRNTIARWCRQGLPHKRGAPGKEHQMELRTVIPWSLGRKWATEKNVDLSALECILVGLAYGFIGGKENPSFATWRLQMIQETDWFDATQQQITFAIGRLSGLGCLPFRHSRW